MSSLSSPGSLSSTWKHPSQRLHSPSRTLSLILHGAGLYDFMRCFDYLQAHPNRINQSYGWHFQFLTILGTALITSEANFAKVSSLPPSLFLSQPQRIWQIPRHYSRSRTSLCFLLLRYCPSSDKVVLIYLL
jgi:hypothetical protein